MRVLRRVVIVVFFVFGCSSSSDPAPSAPVQACSRVLDETCSAFERCGKSTKADCMSQGGVALDCSKAVGTSTNLQACLDALPTPACATFPPLPAVCQGVILEQRSAHGISSSETLVPVTMAPLAREVISP